MEIGGKLVREQIAVAMTAVARWNSGGQPSDRYEPKSFMVALNEEYRRHAEGNGITLLHPNVLKSGQLFGCVSRSLALSNESKIGEHVAMVILRTDGLLESGAETSPHPLTAAQAQVLLRHTMRRSGQVVTPKSWVPTLLTEAEAARQAMNIAQHAAGAMRGPIYIPGKRRQWTDREVSSLITGVEYRRIRYETHRFHRMLDPAILWAMAATSATSIGHYNVYADPRFGRNRLQAAMAFPLLMSGILETPDLLQVVDAGKKLTEALAEVLEVRVPLIRRLRGVPVRFVPLVERGRSASLELLKSFAQALGELPLDHVPSKRREWVSFISLWRASRAYSVNTAFRRPMLSLQQAARGKWVETVDAILNAGDGPLPSFGQPLVRIAVLERMMRDANELVAAIFRNFVYPLAVRALADRNNVDIDQTRTIINNSAQAGDLTAIASQMVFDGLSPSAIAKKSTECHKIPRLFADFSGTSSWHPLFSATLTAPNGVQIVSLANVHALSEEGNTMRHCVASYASACAFDGHHILSFRSPSLQPLSTVEIQRVALKAGVQVLQHRGIGNSPPPPTAISALNWLVYSVATGSINIDVATIEKKLASRCAERNSPVKVLLDGPIIEAFTIWHPYLSKPWSAFSYQELMIEMNERVLKTELARLASRFI